MATLLPIDLMSSHTVPVGSLLSALTPDPVQFSGNAMVKSRVVRDPVFGRPSMLFLVNLWGVQGVTQSGGTRFTVMGEEHIVRPLATKYDLAFNFVACVDGSGSISTSRVGLAKLALIVNPSSGNVTSLTATLGLV